MVKTENLLLGLAAAGAGYLVLNGLPGNENKSILGGGSGGTNFGGLFEGLFDGFGGAGLPNINLPGIKVPGFDFNLDGLVQKIKDAIPAIPELPELPDVEKLTSDFFDKFTGPVKNFTENVANTVNNVGQNLSVGGQGALVAGIPAVLAVVGTGLIAPGAAILAGGAGTAIAGYQGRKAVIRKTNAPPETNIAAFFKRLFGGDITQSEGLQFALSPIITIARESAQTQETPLDSLASRFRSSNNISQPNKPITRGRSSGNVSRARANTLNNAGFTPSPNFTKASLSDLRRQSLLPGAPRIPGVF